MRAQQRLYFADMSASPADHPQNAENYNHLGNSLQTAGRLAEAVDAYARALSLRPDFFEAMANLGVVLSKLERVDESIDVLNRAIRLRPGSAEAHAELAGAFRRKEQSSQAIACLRRALELRPDFPSALNQLGQLLLEQRSIDEAVAAFRRLVALQSNKPQPYNNLGNALAAQGKMDEALQQFHKALALQPDNTEVLGSLANALARLRRFDEAERAYRRGLEVAPQSAELRWNLGLMQLLLGDYPQGWQNYEARWQLKTRFFYRKFNVPLWNGSDLAGKRVVLHAEQGFGDAIQFVRYAPMVAARGARVVLQCQPELQRLFRSIQEVDQVINDEQEAPAVDLHCPLMTLPMRFGTTVQSIPSRVPYLWADANEIRKWRDRLSGFDGTLKVGISWTGDPKNANNRDRSVGLEALSPLLQMPGASFFSLQKQLPKPGPAQIPGGIRCNDWTAELQDFADTAALVSQLDLVITIDSAVAHLAGALGKPVWVLLSYAGDWRYLLDREDSPWYPTMRLFRQIYSGQWKAPIERAGDELKRLANLP